MKVSYQYKGAKHSSISDFPSLKAAKRWASESPSKEFRDSFKVIPIKKKPSAPWNIKF